MDKCRVLKHVSMSPGRSTQGLHSEDPVLRTALSVRGLEALLAHGHSQHVRHMEEEQRARDCAAYSAVQHC